MVYTLRFFSSKCSLFHNFNIFGSCIIHILYIYSKNIGTEYFKHGIYSPFFSSSKCSLFHNSNIFGSCIIHILYTGCAKIKKKSCAKCLTIFLVNPVAFTWFSILLRNHTCIFYASESPFVKLWAVLDVKFA